MSETRRQYTAEFKREALELYRNSQRPASAIEAELGIGDGCLLRWKLEDERAGGQAFPGTGHLSAEDERLRTLERELEVVRQERDILKKAVAIFSRPNR